jgi:ABC-type oligopeptide transport system substrate-binding subunit
MDEQTAETFEEARRQLFDPTVEDDDILLAKASIKRAEEMRASAQESIKDLKALKKLEKKLDERIKSQKKWVRTLKEIQEQKIKRQEEIRQAAE